jgi:hypothetical protein
MDAGWMCMVILTIRPSLASERGPPVPNGRETAEPRPFGTSVIVQKTFPSSVLKIRFLQSSQSWQKLLYANEDETTLITWLISNASCFRTWGHRCSEIWCQSIPDFDRYTVPSSSMVYRSEKNGRTLLWSLDYPVAVTSYPRKTGSLYRNAT